MVGKLLRVFAQNDALVNVDEHPATVNNGDLGPVGIVKMGDALIDGPLAALRLGDKGQFFVHAGCAVNMQSQFGQHKGRAGGGVDFIGQPGGFGVGGGNLLGIAQQRTGLYIAEMVAIVAVDGEFLRVGFGCSGHRVLSLWSIAKSTYPTV